MMIQVIGKLNDPTIHYVIAGSGPLQDELEKLAERFGVKNNVHFLGFCTNVYEILKASDIFCFPSYQEGLPVSLMEAMATGLPTVVSAVRGNTDLIAPNKGGFLYSVNDVNGFTDGIQKLVQNPELRNKMGEYNKKRIKDNDIRIIKEELAGVYFPHQNK